MRWCASWPLVPAAAKPRQSRTPSRAALAELDRAETARADARREAADEVLRVLDRLLTDEDKRAIRRNEAVLYDENGLPR